MEGVGASDHGFRQAWCWKCHPKIRYVPGCQAFPRHTSCSVTLAHSLFYISNAITWRQNRGRPEGELHAWASAAGTRLEHRREKGVRCRFQHGVATAPCRPRRLWPCHILSFCSFRCSRAAWKEKDDQMINRQVRVTVDYGYNPKRSSPNKGIANVWGL